jgi:hypothetical protein
MVFGTIFAKRAKLRWINMKRIILVLLTLVFSLCFYAGCNNNVEGNNPVTGVKDGYIYVLEFGDVSAKFEKGQATLSLNGGSANAYSSGDKITEVGNYCLEWTDGKQSKTISFRVRHKTPDAPVVSGVKDGDVVEYGAVLKPLFDKGSAVLSNGTDETPFTSGSEISKVGVYTLTVNYQEVCTVVKFEIKLPSYAGQITDEFLGGEINSGWSTSDATLSIENDALVINDMADNNGYCIVSRQFTEIDLIKYPYVEIETSNLYNCSLKFRLSASKYPTATDPVIYTKAYSNGKNYIDVKSYVEQNNLDVSCASL